MCYEKSQKDNLIMKYLPLVKKIADKIEVKGNRYEKDDLVSLGVIGLLDAIDKYDYKKNVPFEAYATLRIRGAIIDEFRKSGRVSRDRIYKLNEYYRAKEELENKLMRTPEELEICQELGIDSKELYKIHETVHYLSDISLESVVFSEKGSEVQLIDLVKDEHVLLPEEHIIKSEQESLLKDAISSLKEREQIILNLYYTEELSLKEIAYILGISIPRVSQIHGKILLKLRHYISVNAGEA